MANKIPGDPNMPIPKTQAPAPPDTNAGPAAPQPKDPMEEAHFRMDDHERRMGALEEATKPEHVAAVVGGAAAAVHGSMQAKFDSLLATMREDVKTDAEVSKGIKDLIASNSEVVGAIKELIQAMSASRTRTVTAHLPTGPLKIQSE
jgi:hypothetical protein